MNPKGYFDKIKKSLALCHRSPDCLGSSLFLVRHCRGMGGRS